METKDTLTHGRVTVPTDVDVIPETLEVLKRWGGDALRDCDGTAFPEELKSADAKIYATYYTTRKDNAWAKANPDEVQQCYIMTGFRTARGDSLTIPLMEGISTDLLKVNTRDDITRWWEVMDRTTGEVVPTDRWHYADGAVKEALYLASLAKHLTIIHFEDQLGCIAEFRQKVAAAENISLRLASRLHAVYGQDQVERLEIANEHDGSIETVEDPGCGIFVYAGVEPNTQLYPDLALEGGYIPTNDKMETAIPGVYAAGDIRVKQVRQVATAVSDGAIAAINAAM